MASLLQHPCACVCVLVCACVSVCVCVSFSVCVCVCVCERDWLAVSCAAGDVVSAVGNPSYLSALSRSLHPSASVSLQYDVSAGVSSARSRLSHTAAALCT